MSKLHRKVAIYLRTCNPQSSIEDQRLEVEKLCARQGWEIAVVYEDPGCSGLTMDRPGLRGMLNAVSRGQFSVIVASDPSRLSRSGDELLYILHCLHVYGIGFCAAIQAMERPRGDDDDISGLLWKMHAHTVMPDWPWCNPPPERLKLVSSKRMKKLRAHPSRRAGKVGGFTATTQPRGTADSRCGTAIG